METEDWSRVPAEEGVMNVPEESKPWPTEDRAMAEMAKTWVKSRWVNDHGYESLIWDEAFMACYRWIIEHMNN